MIKWELPLGDQPTLTRAKKCVLNPGVLYSSGDQISHPARIWVGDALIDSSPGSNSNENGTGGCDRSIFVVPGESDLKHR